MPKRWIFSLGLVVVIALAGWVVWRWEINNIQNNLTSTEPRVTTNTSTLPLELTKNFNPTINTPVFAIVSADKSQKTLRLKMVFPEGYLREEVTSVIACKEPDIKVSKNGKDVAVGSAAFFKAIDENPKGSLTLMGICSDTLCKEMNQRCVLYVQ
jgi:hypothetical protein